MTYYDDFELDCGCRWRCKCGDELDEEFAIVAEERDGLEVAVRHVLRYGRLGKRSAARLRAALPDAFPRKDADARRHAAAGSKGSVTFREWPSQIKVYLCPRHGITKNVVGMGRDRPPLCMITDARTREPCGTTVEVGIYTRDPAAHDQSRLSLEGDDAS